MEAILFPGSKEIHRTALSCWGSGGIGGPLIDALLVRGLAFATLVVMLQSLRALTMNTHRKMHMKLLCKGTAHVIRHAPRPLPLHDMSGSTNVPKMVPDVSWLDPGLTTKWLKGFEIL